MGEVIEAAFMPSVGDAAARLLGVLTPMSDADGLRRRAFYALVSDLHASGVIGRDEVIDLWHRPTRAIAPDRGGRIVRFDAHVRRR
ncbi:MAG: hypothetical protein U5L06_05510 [Rhodovibrio sp.]|nr:hypothetical protein [Rhodovibrio sp.]